MATWRAELVTKDAVMAYYDSSEFVMYRVFAGNRPTRDMLRYNYLGTDKSIGMAELSDALDAIIANPLNVNQYVLQILASEGKVNLDADKRSKVIDDATNIVFQLNFANGSMYPSVVNPNSGNGQILGMGSSKMEILLEELVSQNRVLVSKLSAQDDEGDDIENDAAMGATNPLFKLLDNPQIQGIIADKIIGFFGGNNKPQTMAGVPSDNDMQIQKAIEILKNFTPTLGGDLMKLAEMAQNNTGQFNMMLNVLRAN